MADSDIPAEDVGLLYKDEVYAIVGAAFEVANELGCGFLEAVYHEALEIEFQERKIPYESEKDIRLFFKGQQLKKEYSADFLCFGKIIVEIKAIKNLSEIDDAQIIHYLKATRMRVGVLINFGGMKLEWKRFVNTR
jgi:GxxExxY protein